MATVHLEFEKKDIANIVIMPGDPLRADYIAKTYLENAVRINNTRNCWGYTGYYQGKRISVLASGMGIPSMGIYAFELFNDYDVDYIIRVGTAGGLKENIAIGDVIVVDEAFSESNFAKIYNNDPNDTMQASKYLNDLIEIVAKEKGIVYKKGKIITSDVFEPHIDGKVYHDPRPSDLLASEMESFALFFLAKYSNKQATTILTVSDSPFTDKTLTPDERQNSLDEMIKLALDASFRVKE